MKRQKSPFIKSPPVAQAILENGELWFNNGQRELSPIAMLGAAALMLRNISPQPLVDAVAPALVEMVEFADEETQEELEEFAKEGRSYTFDMWLTNFQFKPFEYHQPDIWQPFLDALDELP